MPAPVLPATGQLRHLLQVQARTAAPNGYGEKVPVFSTFLTVWGEVMPLSGRETQQAAQTQADVTHRVTVRYVPGLEPRMQFLWQGKVLRITSVLDVGGLGRFHECACTQEV